MKTENIHTVIWLSCKNIYNHLCSLYLHAMQSSRYFPSCWAKLRWSVNYLEPVVQKMISCIIYFFVFPVSRKYGHLLSLDLPESKITTTTTNKGIFKYLSHTRSDLFGFEKKKWLNID